MSSARNDKRDFLTGVVCVVSGAGFYINVHLQEMMKFDLLGSKFFPKIACMGIIFFGGLLALQSAVKIKALEHSDRSAAENNDENFFNKKKLLFVIYSVAYFAVLELSVGFLYATPVYMLLDMILLEIKKPSLSKIGSYALFSVVVTFATHQFFSKVLYLLLP